MCRFLFVIFINTTYQISKVVIQPPMKSDSDMLAYKKTYNKHSCEILI